MQNPKVRKVYFNNCAVLVNSILVIVSYWRVIDTVPCCFLKVSSVMLFLKVSSVLLMLD
jgi:hypothetical protein